MLKNKYDDVILAGNIGSSALNYLDKADRDTIFVLELSSYQLSDMKVSPHIATCINLYNDHADWHGSKQRYWDDKKNITKYSSFNDIFIYNPDFEELRKWANETHAKSIAIDTSKQIDLSGSSLFGEHNELNALIAIEIAKQLGVSEDDAIKSIDSFKPLEHRMEMVDKRNGITYIDDAIGMTPESTKASMKAVTDKYGPIGCIMLGGKDRDYDFTELLEIIADYNIPNLVLFPDTIQKIRSSIPENYAPNIYETSDMKEAVNFAANNSPKDSVVLLSTAAPSYSIWQDFEDKGNQFKQAVQEI